MLNDVNYLSALQELQGVLKRFIPGVKVYDDIVPFRDQVLNRYGPIFSMDHIPELTAEEYASFLHFRNNHHWSSLHRTGLGAAADIATLRKALSVLLDESIPIRDRLPKSIQIVHGWGKAIATAILTVAYPSKYGVWNSTSEEGLRRVRLWPEIDNSVGIGGQYEAINEIFLKLSKDLGIDLWTLDAFWWHLGEATGTNPIGKGQAINKTKLRDLLQQVLYLQKQWSSENTPEMKHRGEIIRNDIPAYLRVAIGQLGTEFSDFGAEGKDGTGRKTRVPWARIFIPEFSPSATKGWYVVYLFSADGSAVYLSINQGTNKIQGGALIPLDESFLLQRVATARSQLASSFIDGNEPNKIIKLCDQGGIGDLYERGNVYCVEYQGGAIPDDDALLRDLKDQLTLLKRLYENETRVVDKTRPAYLLVWNPKIWEWPSLKEDAVKEGKVKISWTTLSGKIKPGDRVFLMRVGKEPKGVMALGHALSEPHEAPHHSDPSKTSLHVDLEWEKILVPPEQPPLGLKALSAIDPNYIWTPQASGLIIPPDTAARLEVEWSRYLASIVSQHDPKDEVATYGESDLAKEVFFPAELLGEWLYLLRARRNLVLQGPPGVGKTYLARRLAYALFGNKDDSRIEWVQFHQSYAYEEFVQGYRPSDGGGFTLVDGIFYRFCQRAQAQSPRPHVFIIDEINRGNLSRIFGEVLSLIEDDKRGDLATTLAYSPDGPPFSVPPNVYLVGLMNTSDRSLAIIDYALRRRFRFADLEPQLHSDKFRLHLLARGISEKLIQTIIERIGDLNAAIREDTRNLGRGFEIGHSYFCPTELIADEAQWFRTVIRYEIAPLLREYWFDTPEKADEATKKLLA